MFLAFESWSGQAHFTETWCPSLLPAGGTVATTEPSSGLCNFSNAAYPSLRTARDWSHGAWTNHHFYHSCTNSTNCTDSSESSANLNSVSLELGGSHKRKLMQKAPGPGVAHSWNILDFSWVLISVNLIFVPISFLPCYGRCTSCILQLKMGLTMQFINQRKQTATILTGSLQYFALVYCVHYPFSIGLYTFLRLHIWLSAKQFSDGGKVNSKDSGKNKKQKKTHLAHQVKQTEQLFFETFFQHTWLLNFSFPPKSMLFRNHKNLKGSP